LVVFALWPNYLRIISVWCPLDTETSIQKGRLLPQVEETILEDSCLLRRCVQETVSDVSKYHSAFIVRIKQYDTVTDHEDDLLLYINILVTSSWSVTVAYCLILTMKALWCIYIYIYIYIYI